MIYEVRSPFLLPPSSHSYWWLSKQMLILN
jgi:hypothetical protein